jgi:hypothetical protein
MARRERPKASGEVSRLAIAMPPEDGGILAAKHDPPMNPDHDGQPGSAFRWPPDVERKIVLTAGLVRPDQRLDIECREGIVALRSSRPCPSCIAFALPGATACGSAKRNAPVGAAV